MKNQYEIDYQQGYDKANEEWLDRMALPEPYKGDKEEKENALGNNR